MKKLVILLTTIIIIFLIFLYNLFAPKSYEYKYKVDNYEITEKYDKNNKIYDFIVKKQRKKYKYSIKHKYVSKRGLVTNIKTNKSCIKVKHNSLKEMNICIKKNEYTTKYYNDKIKQKLKNEYKNIKVYDLKDNKFYIWNYNNFVIIDGKNNKTMSLFNDDIYVLNIIYKINKYLVVADYNEEYKFSKFYMIDMKKDKYEEIDINRKLHMTSYILGDYKDNIYIYDPEQEKEFKFNPFNKEFEDNPYEVLINNKWEKTSKNKLNKKNIKFENDSKISYIIKKNKLYYQMTNSKILVTNMKVSNIISQNDDECYFMAGDSLYYVDLNRGITLVMKYSEWKFNNQNIYLY